MTRHSLSGFSQPMHWAASRYSITWNSAFMWSSQVHVAVREVPARCQKLSPCAGQCDLEVLLVVDELRVERREPHKAPVFQLPGRELDQDVDVLLVDLVVSVAA